jgi:hypothetical protein
MSILTMDRLQGRRPLLPFDDKLCGDVQSKLHARLLPLMKDMLAYVAFAKLTRGPVLAVPKSKTV